MEQDNKHKNEKQTTQTQNLTRSAFVGLKAGCLTFVVAGAALGVGLLLDTRLGTYPRWTLILLIVSAPFTLGGVYWMARRALKKAGGKDRGEERDEIDPGS
ncbi:MAG: AtpZ/AtpI family protein [Chloroflexota bacterium]|nr:AtpZ/AtpI family protein [Chloroflexota bacterium]